MVWCGGIYVIDESILCVRMCVVVVKNFLEWIENEKTSG